ncbi:nuclear envelope integral membrane protein [Cylas formicarius]|uniref:nuclear envelope integral membrane protein n=1 Tax=Cylas formicarius TaxID=197179 RepID=UPI0029583E9C|nr:nuclear envelope integral membrane protein [Cylas formicarius]
MRIANWIVLITVFLLTKSTSCAFRKDSNKLHFLEQDEVYRYEPIYKTKDLHIFCYQGKPKYIVHIWQSVVLFIKHSSDDYNQYDGNSPEEVENEWLDKRYSWSVAGLWSSKSKAIKLNPFNTSCIGIESKESYSVHLKVIRIDLWKVLSMVFGVLLFLAANNLSKNTLFHYVCGITFGICASFLLLIYFISKLFPRKPLMYGVIGCGWTIVIYFLQILWDNLKVVMTTYKMYVLWYILVTGSVSFILCYRWGPVENKRTVNLIKWSLQLSGLVAIFLSSHFQEAAMAQIVILLLATITPKKWVSAPKKYWKRRFPPKIKLLTNDQYYEQGARETAKALTELRQYCSSPECNQWKTALKIKDVKRFASFVEGNSHLSDDEILEYETSVRGELTDEEEENSELSDDE